MTENNPELVIFAGTPEEDGSIPIDDVIDGLTCLDDDFNTPEARNSVLMSTFIENDSFFLGELLKCVDEDGALSEEEDPAQEAEPEQPVTPAFNSFTQRK